MSSEPSAHHQLNQEVASKQRLLDLIRRPDFATLLTEFAYEWDSGHCNSKSEIFDTFNSLGWVGSDSTLSRIGKLVYGRMAVHFSDLETSQHSTVGNYKIVKRLRSGKNSVIFIGEHVILGFNAILKFVRPGASDDIERSLRILATGRFHGTIVMPTDLLKVQTVDITGRGLTVSCLVFPLVEGQSFNDFLNEKNNHLNSHVVIAFIKQIGAALEELERIGAYHGDLHSHNILVGRGLGGLLEFKLLDISYDAIGSVSSEESQNSDLDNFKQHVWRILSEQKRCMPNISLRKFIGTKYFNKITYILSDSTKSFQDVMQIFRSDVEYSRFLDAQTRFLAEKFAAPNSFRLQRYEEFTDPAVAARLFVPFPELQTKINEFGNVYVSGNRGSGKSTYLASLAYFPSVDDPTVDFSLTFGVYFPCRQGEFRALSPAKNCGEELADYRTLHILTIKVMRRTLEAIAEGISRGGLSNVANYKLLQDFFDNFVPEPGMILLESEILSEIDNFVSTAVRLELDEIRNINSQTSRHHYVLTANDLIKFFEILKIIFPELRHSRFYILFDDAGEPYVERNIQRAINELIINSNPIYCVKLSAEKNTYLFETCSGKALENGHDYYEQDISYSLFIGSGTTGITRERLETYFRQIVKLRLTYFRYRSADIRDYLGDQPDGDNRLTTLLALGRKDAYYCGWTTVWNVADRNARNLLELVSEIFTVGQIEQETIPHQIPMRDQSRAIKTISDKRLQSLSQIAGSFLLNGRRVSVGRKLFDVTATIGSIFFRYLRQEISSKGSHRVRQHLAVERNDLVPLNSEAEFILQKLETFGVFDSSKSAVARDDRVRKPIYVLNRIYCPAFSIGYRRDDHLKLSKDRFEQLLLQPQAFLREGTRRLKSSGQSQIELFGYNLSELGEE